MPSVREAPLEEPHARPGAPLRRMVNPSLISDRFSHWNGGTPRGPRASRASRRGAPAGPALRPQPTTNCWGFSFASGTFPETFCFP